ncbi:NAD(P)H-binding protein [Azoarcus sp. PA01]|nr:NAD(P)H-binding protein [Azoarcus sp. PA01]
MILVTGASGQLGRRIVQWLSVRLPEGGAGQLAVSVRDPARVTDFAARGIDVRRGNFDRGETLSAAFAGVECLVLVSTDGPADACIGRHRNAIQAATAAGVRRVCYTSFLDADATSPSAFARIHAAAEADLAASGLACTVLRNGLYADFMPIEFAAALRTGVLRLPAADGKVSHLSRNELAEAIAAAAIAPRLEKQTYELTGQTAHDYRDLAARVAAAVGKTLRYEAVPARAAAESAHPGDMPAGTVRALAPLYASIAGNRLARTTNDFAALVGHPPKSVDCLVAEFFRAPRA